jgi:CBS domain containing-hemolysin-like protein
MKEMEGKASAKYLKNLKGKIDRPLSAILTINTVAHTVGAAGVGAQAVSVFGEIYFGLISAILTILILFFSEIIPKTIGAVYWRKLALPTAIVIMGMIYLSYPFVIISEFITKIISKNKKSQTISREEVVALAHIGKKEGVLKESESKIIDNLIKLSTLKVRVIMTPRTVVVSAPEDISLDKFIKRSEYMKYSRIPVYSGNIDNVTGYVLKSDVLEKLAKENRNQGLKAVKRPIIIFYESFSIPKLFEELIMKKEHMALIIDEHGGMQGIATMEDIIETILGLEIMDEKDIEANMQELAKKKWEMSKKINIKKG